MLRRPAPDPTTMTAILHAGGCHCGALRLEFSATRPLSSCVARACDCDFCSRHRAAWVSDPAGQLRIRAEDVQLQRYRQGSAQAEFLLCRECGVLVAVIARAVDGRLLGAANRNALNEHMEIVEETIVSPRLLAADAKLARWSDVWMPADLST
jgi:hypothetical protein